MNRQTNHLLEDVRRQLIELSAGEDINTFNTKLAKLFQKLKKDAGASTIKQNYKGTGSQKFRRQLWCRFKSGAVIDLWLEKNAVSLGGVVTNGVGNKLEKKVVLYQEKTPEQVYAEAMPILRDWANAKKEDLDEAVNGSKPAELVGKPLSVKLWAINGKTLGDQFSGFIEDMIDFKRLKWVKRLGRSGVSKGEFRFTPKSKNDVNVLFVGLRNSASDGNLDRYRVNVIGEGVDEATSDEKIRRKLILGIYKRINVSDKMIRAKKHKVQLVGSNAKEFGVGNYTLVGLEDQTTPDLQRLARVVGAPTS